MGGGFEYGQSCNEGAPLEVLLGWINNHGLFGCHGATSFVTIFDSLKYNSIRGNLMIARIRLELMDDLMKCSLLSYP